MEYKERKKPIELEVLEILDARMKLAEKGQQHHYNLKKGYEGELAFDELTRDLRCDCLVLNDLLLQVGSTTFQIDTLIIADMLYLFEVKNHEGDFYYDNDRKYTKANYEITNPVNQINRSESLIRQLIQILNVTTQINSSVVFINPAFTLYQAPLNKPFILPTQLNRYIKQLDKVNSHITRKHKAFADKLISMHLTESPYKQLPEYTYGELRKGLICWRCESFGVSIVGKYCVCGRCGNKLLVKDAILQAVTEFKLLFPNQKITTQVIYDWCNRLIYKPRIKSILEQSYKHVSNNRWSYFV